ncbi:unnamed protein product (mitochondrion) [Plasmodiophora brassicae]|uniref:Ubiquitin thioesterase OTU n=1 Tax=Plasmodiophora brassicae TaxID=37360 RepID=A0A0G4J2G6_PLABS|nr:hypothetical protein PBRA_002097 [Plasmodiophora brassicae]SPQ93229.1 unnamed protein product [Plasmodiophora brassicae]
MRFRCRYPAGTQVLELREDETVGALVDRITGIVGRPVRVLHGMYPPKPLTAPLSARLGDCPNIRSGDTFTAEITEEQKASGLCKHEIPSDNSCLFHAVRYALQGRNPTAQTTIEDLRRAVADEILSNPSEFPDALLGKPADEYCNWITRPDSWGGEVELVILSKITGLQLVAVDVRTMQLHCYGQGRERVYLLYDGIHYDVLEDPMTRAVFSSQDETVERMAREFAALAHAASEFTDVNGFQLRCDVCRKGLTGQADALQHAKTTGHTSFSEYTA